MLQLLKNPKFDFMSRGKLLLSVSAVLVLLSIVALFVRSATKGQALNLGIEFTGGTELQLKFIETPDVAEIRSTLQNAGLTSQVVTTIGDPTENEIYIRIGVAEDEEKEEDLTTKVGRALRAGSVQQGRQDLNVADTATLERILLGAPGMTRDRAFALAEGISEARKESAIFRSFDDLAALPGMTSEALDRLREQGYIGPLAVRSQSYIGPAIGEELKRKTVMAIMFSLAGMLIYIWIRFQLQWGFAAVVALTHDTLITLGAFSVFDKEMSLPVVAAFLTLVGYSVNDTVVVFDRIRENVRNRSAPTFEATINLSLNQTLSRTIITSGLTFVVVFGLYLYGGGALNPFAFVLSIGVIVGTYSSIYIASPILVLWKQYRERKLRSADSVAAGTRPAKKIRTTS